MMAGMTAFLVSVRVVLAGLFLFSAATKLRSPSQLTQFVDSLRSMTIAPERWVSSIAVTVAVAELGTGALILLDASHRAGLIAAAMLLISFAVAIVVSVRRGAQTTCRCLGASTRPLGRLHVARNASLAAIAVLAAASPGSSSLSAEELVVVVFVALAVLVHLLFLDDLADVVAKRPRSALPSREGAR